MLNIFKPKPISTPTGQYTTPAPVQAVGQPQVQITATDRNLIEEYVRLLVRLIKEQKGENQAIIEAYRYLRITNTNEREVRCLALALENIHTYANSYGVQEYLQFVNSAGGSVTSIPASQITHPSSPQISAAAAPEPQPTTVIPIDRQAQQQAQQQAAQNYLNRQIEQASTAPSRAAEASDTSAELPDLEALESQSSSSSPPSPSPAKPVRSRPAKAQPQTESAPPPPNPIETALANSQGSELEQIDGDLSASLNDSPFDWLEMEMGIFSDDEFPQEVIQQRDRIFLALQYIKKLSNYEFVWEGCDYRSPQMYVHQIRQKYKKGTFLISANEVATELAQYMSLLKIVPKGKKASIRPGYGCITIEIPKERRDIIRLVDALADGRIQRDMVTPWSPLKVWLGVDQYGNDIEINLSIPTGYHLLIGGNNGGGKSILLNTLVEGMLLRYRREYVQFVLIDVQRVNFSHFAKFTDRLWKRYGLVSTVEEITELFGVPHLSKKGREDEDEEPENPQLGGLIFEDIFGTHSASRTSLFLKAGVDNLDDYNRYATANKLPILPHVVILIDEVAGIGVRFGKRKHLFDARLQLLLAEGRKYGYHVIAATQDPTADAKGAITGPARSQFGNRICLYCRNPITSERIMGEGFKEGINLSGNGDGFLSTPEAPNLEDVIRFQAYYTPKDDLERLYALVSRGRQMPDTVPIPISAKSGQKALQGQVGQKALPASSDPFEQLASEFLLEEADQFEAEEEPQMETPAPHVQSANSHSQQERKRIPDPTRLQEAQVNLSDELPNCPTCQSDADVIRNGKDRNQNQKYLCRNCSRSFSDRTPQGTRLRVLSPPLERKVGG